MSRRIILTVDNKQVYDSNSVNNLTNNVSMDDLIRVLNPIVNEMYYYESDVMDENNKPIIKQGNLKGKREDDTGMNQYTTHYIIENEKNDMIDKLYRKNEQGGGARRKSSRKNPKKKTRRNRRKSVRRR